MVHYKVTVSTGDRLDATTLSDVYIKLVGTDGESQRKLLRGLQGATAFMIGQVSTFTVSCPESLGNLVLIELDKKPSVFIIKDNWFPAKVEVLCPEGNTCTFPIYRWINNDQTNYFREATAMKVFEDTHPLGAYFRQQEMKKRETDYHWAVYEEGFPHCIKTDDNLSLPAEVQFSFTKDTEFKLTAATTLTELKLTGYVDCNKTWPDLESINRVFWKKTDILPTPTYLSSLKKMCWLTCKLLRSAIQDGRTRLSSLLGPMPHLSGFLGPMSHLSGFLAPISHLSRFLGPLLETKTIPEYVMKHWKEDAFFGYQFLNGVNPMLIRRCSALPSNLSVTDDMVFPSGQYSLAEEMKKGNIFLCDYKNLDGVKANTINGKQQYLTAPLVLLHRTPDANMMPLAIQLKQTPADDNPVFLPSDSEYDWLTAKIFVRSADFTEHQLNTHLLRTHLLAEVFAVSLLRNLPMVHPLYKLLIPHTRYTLQINYLARLSLISETGVFTKFSASGGEGMTTILKRSLSSMTYSSLCLPEDIAERGLEAVPNFYYKDDGLRLWKIIHRFVEAVIGNYYKDDTDVQNDSELQKWIGDIFEHGFLSQTKTGIPQRFSTVTKLNKFVTMVIFTGSCQHAAVNSGQYDYGGWMPNAPSTLQLPPPTRKGTTSEKTMLQTLPDISTTVQGMATMWLLSKQSSDFVPFGQYPEEHFSERIPCQLIKAFQAELKELSSDIRARNSTLKLPYPYLDPAELENSVAI
ncbi:hydroperoxide isomerase ALOXE3-like [Betta splendens]|uniref:Hydroperoxide isomerase ALOXE3-like n=1 Tax=Betta splendens TaxID=158456 RepID=A0A6P7NQ16_BETSP|nr:hydroperoxide isomerase ALOXE3-like [Betta splendens]XP_029020100.1 hydroperoxide isomerase ALOXE3-like [Betta splendens]